MSIFQKVLGMLTTYDGTSTLVASAILSWQKMSKMEDEELVEKIANDVHLSNRIEKARELEEKSANQLYKDLQYIATEKIDGCNWSCVLVIDHGQIINAGIFKRSAQITDEKDLYKGSISIIENHIEQIQLLARHLFETTGESYIDVTLFGEFYGPSLIYRVNYPKLDIIFYSIVLQGHRLRFNESWQYFANAQLPVVPIVMRGTFNEIYNWLKETDRKIASFCIKNFVNVSDPKNYMEGVVLYPITHGHIMKCRSTRFLEKKIKIKKDSSRKETGVPLSRQQINELVLYIDKVAISNRISNHMSKVGFETFKQDIDKSIREIIDDIVVSIPNIDQIREEWIRKASYKNVHIQCHELIKNPCIIGKTDNCF